MKRYILFQQFIPLMRWIPENAASLWRILWYRRRRKLRIPVWMLWIRISNWAAIVVVFTRRKDWSRRRSFFGVQSMIWFGWKVQYIIIRLWILFNRLILWARLLEREQNLSIIQRMLQMINRIHISCQPVLKLLKFLFRLFWLSCLLFLRIS